MEGIFDLEMIGEGIAEGCAVGVTDGVMEGMFDLDMIGEGIAEGCIVGVRDGVTVWIADRFIEGDIESFSPRLENFSLEIGSNECISQGFSK